jgi:adhesin/invasin
MKQPICLHTVGSTLKHLALAVALAVGLGAGTSQAEPPVNDNFADAIDLTGSGTGQTGIATLGTQSGTGTVGATSESGETVWASSNTVWFKWTCATAGFLTFSTEGSLSIYNGPWDAAMSAYTGSSLATLTQLVAQDTTTAEIVTMEVVPGTYYIQACGYNLPPPDDTADLQLSWSFKVQSDTLVDISNAIGPSFDGGVSINDIVGLGNIGNIVGETRTYWDSKGFVVPLILNDNTLIIDSGNGNSMNAQGPISGNGTVTIDGGGSDTVLISGSTGNTYTGTTQVAQGPVGLAKNNGNALCGAITVTGSTVVWGASNQISDTSSVTLDATSVLDLAGFSDTIGNLTMATGSTVATGTSGVLTANTLMVNGTPVTAGTYTSSSSFVTGTGSLVVSNTAVVPASAANSTVTASPAEVQANGTSASTITVTLFNASNAPAPGKTVTLASSRALGIDTIAEASGVSDASGVVTFAVTSTTIGNPVFTATDTTDSVTITDTATVSFIAINYVVDISTTLTPGPDGPTQGIVIDTVVGEGYSGRLVGSTQTYWGSGGFSRALDLNGNTLIIDNGNGNTMNASGAISGNGIVQVDGGGGNPVRIMGDTGNTYTGTTEVLEGPVNLEKTSGNALCGAITVTGSTVVWAASDQISDTSNVSLGSSSVLNLAGFSDTIGNLTMTTGSTVATGGIGGILTVNSLILDGTPVTAGTYTSSSAFVSGDGSLVVSTTATLPASAANSTLAASPSSVLADGTSTSTITVTLLDAGSPPAPIAGKTVTLASNRSAGTDTISTTSSVSDASGVVTFTVQSSTAGSAIFTATDTTDSITITATATVTYTTPPTYVDISNATTPWEPAIPAAGVRINEVVASGNTARLIGLTQTHWGSGGFSRPLTLNGNTLIIDNGGGNPINISGAITGTGVITFNGWVPIRFECKVPPAMTTPPPTP